MKEKIKQTTKLLILMIIEVMSVLVALTGLISILNHLDLIPLHRNPFDVFDSICFIIVSVSNIIFIRNCFKNWDNA